MDHSPPTMLNWVKRTRSCYSQCCAWFSLGTQEADPWAKNHITGLGTARKSDSVLEPETVIKQEKASNGKLPEKDNIHKRYST